VGPIVDVLLVSSSLESINGLGAPNELKEGAVENPGLPNSSSSPARKVVGNKMKDSACHSYHTRRSFVSRHIETWSSELLGRYNGSLGRLNEKYNGAYITARTLNGKKRGNQLNMSFETWSFLCGCMLSPMFPYKTCGDEIKHRTFFRCWKNSLPPQNILQGHYHDRY